MAWTLADMRTTFRSLTGRKSTSQTPNATVDNYLNDYYRFDLAEMVEMEKFRSDWTQEATATDSGEYTLSEDVITIEEPFFANDEELVVCYDKEEFFRSFPDIEDYITSPTLVIGTTNTYAVRHSAFKFKIGGWTYSKVAGETALSGDTIPQDKYGAWLLEIDSAGTITVSEADDNATGYDTAALAVDALPSETEDQAVMGYVTAINTSATFVPGTTGLDASGVTATYTNGRALHRNAPQAVLIDQSAEKVYIRPKVNDIYLLKAKLSLQRPTALSDVDHEPLNTKWGLAICLGASIKCLMTQGGMDDKINDLRYGPDPLNPSPGSLEYELDSIRLKTLRQLRQKHVERSF